MGRRTKLTPETQKRIVDAIAAGNYNDVAARYAGVTEATFYNWMLRGEQAQSGIYLEFLEAVKAAQAQAETRNVAIIQTAAQQTWQAAAWWLERKYYDRWGRKDKQEITADVTVHDDTDPRDILADRIATLAARAAQDGGSSGTLP